MVTARSQGRHAFYRAWRIHTGEGKLPYRKR
jgi:hypothetical protein